MPQVLRFLSRLLELKRATITADELAALADDLRDVLLNQKLLIPAQTATHVICDACHDGHVEEVTRIKVGKDGVSFRIRCPDAGWVIVPAERLRQWTIDIPRLLWLLSEGIGRNQSPEESIPDFAWRIGTVEIAGETYGVVFVRNVGIALHSPWSQVSQKFPQTRTIVVGVRDFDEDTTGFAAALTLPSAFTSTDGRFELQLGRIRSVLSSGEITNGNVFQRRGEMWILSFEGDSVYLKDSVGLGYIARLLMERDRDIPAVTLLAARAGIDPLVATGSSGELLDDEAREQYRHRYCELQEDLRIAANNHDSGRTEELQVEMDILANELSSATGLGGRARQKTDADKVRNAVSMAVSRDIKRITKKHGSLGRHLDAFISSGLTFRYSPEPLIDWRT